jgi:hypothetical protein
MKIKRKPVVFHNVISLSAIGEIDSWEHVVQDMRAIIFANDLYAVAPPMFRYIQEDDSAEKILTVFLSLNAPIEPEENSPMLFMEEMKFDDAFVFRLGDVDEKNINETSLLIEACAFEFKVELERPFYYVALDVYGDKMLDIIAPIVGEKSDD